MRTSPLSAIRRWWATLSDLWNLRMHGWVAPNGIDEAIVAAEWKAPPLYRHPVFPNGDPVPSDDGVTREEPMYIILYRGQPSMDAECEVADVLHALRVGDINRFQANAQLYDIAVELKPPILFWATTYELYSGPVLEWND